jgi:hypothetical protein
VDEVDGYIDKKQSGGVSSDPRRRDVFAARHVCLRLDTSPIATEPKARRRRRENNTP